MPVFGLVSVRVEVWVCVPFHRPDIPNTLNRCRTQLPCSTRHPNHNLTNPLTWPVCYFLQNSPAEYVFLLEFQAVLSSDWFNNHTTAGSRAHNLQDVQRLNMIFRFFSQSLGISFSIIVTFFSANIRDTDLTGGLPGPFNLFRFSQKSDNFPSPNVLIFFLIPFFV